MNWVRSALPSLRASEKIGSHRFCAERSNPDFERAGLLLGIRTVLRVALDLFAMTPSPQFCPIVLALPVSLRECSASQTWPRRAPACPQGVAVLTRRPDPDRQRREALLKTVLRNYFASDNAGILRTLQSEADMSISPLARRCCARATSATTSTSSCQDGCTPFPKPNPARGKFSARSGAAKASASSRCSPASRARRPSWRCAIPC